MREVQEVGVRGAGFSQEESAGKEAQHPCGGMQNKIGYCGSDREVIGRIRKKQGGCHNENEL